MIGLIDCNNFYVSCERIFRPDLQNKPVIVLSNNDGCAISRSNEVKALGVPMGAPLFQIQRLLEAHQTAIFSSNFALYGDISARVMQLVESLVPKIEVYSIDEAFIDFSGLADISKTALHIRQQIATCIGIPTCIGVAPTKTLAKVANHIAKKNPTRHGICVLKDEAEIDATLQGLEVNDLWGIGKQIASRLNQVGIRSAYQLKKTDPRWMRQNFTVVGERIIHELNGISCLELEPEAQARKSIQVSRSFAKKLKELDPIREAVASYASRLAEKLRHHELKTDTIMVSLCTNRFLEEDRKYYNSTVIKLYKPINDNYSIIKACIQGLEAIYKHGYEYQKAGITALDLIPTAQTQPTLFDQPTIEDHKTENLSMAIDQLNKRFGRGTIHMASCSHKLAWQDKRERKSPSYTSSWNELPVVLAK